MIYNVLLRIPPQNFHLLFYFCQHLKKKGNVLSFKMRFSSGLNYQKAAPPGGRVVLAEIQSYLL